LADQQSGSTRELLRLAIQTSVPETPAQFDQVDWKYVYTPHRHLRALEPDTMLVQGIRGAGKSFWWFVLQSGDNRRRIIGDKAEVSVGFGQGPHGRWPTRDEFEQLLRVPHKPRLIWKAVVLRSIAPDQVFFDNWLRYVDWVTQHPSEVAELFREFDERLSREQRSHLVLFDALDLTADSRDDQKSLLSGLLQLVLEFRAFRGLRAKVFARPDMLGEPDVKSFPDSSKILGAAVNLEWRTTDLYGLLFQYLGNANDTQAATTFRRLVARTAGLATPTSVGVWLVPDALRDDEELQQRVFEAIAGPYMGTNERRGKTYTWVPNHLADALNNVSPRSFLAAIRRAADEPPKHAWALHWSGIQEGVRRASSIRVNEIQEDLPWAHEAMQLLNDLAVPCPRSKVLSTWQKKSLFGRNLPGLPADRDGVLRELSQTGIIRELPDGRLNIPDVYRLGFGLRRKGGFAPRS